MTTLEVISTGTTVEATYWITKECPKSFDIANIPADDEPCSYEAMTDGEGRDTPHLWCETHGASVGFVTYPTRHNCVNDGSEMLASSSAPEWICPKCGSSTSVPWSTGY